MRALSLSLLALPLLASTPAAARPPHGLDPVPWCSVMYDDCADEMSDEMQRCLSGGGTLEDCALQALSGYEACIEAADEVCIDFPGPLFP